MALSDELISGRRLKQLNIVNDPMMQPLIQQLREIKRSGYQEKILLNIVEDLKKVK